MKHQKTIEQEVINFIKRHNLISDVKKIVIGLSGGADSVFAIHFFNKFKNKYKIEISAIHVNHNLRDSESKNDEAFCRNLCKVMNIEFHSVNVNVKNFAETKKKSIEEAARILRYKEFDKNLKKYNSDLIVTAHNNDDNSETVLLNVINGSGIDGIAGIPSKRDKIIRPFLCLCKKDIINYLTKNKIDFVEDSSNLNLEFRRNYLRREIIPLLKNNINPSLDKVLLNSSEVLRNQRTILDFFLNKIIKKKIVTDLDKVFIPINDLKKYPIEIIGELFKIVLKQNFNTDFSFSKSQKIESLFDSQVGVSVDLGNRIFAYRERTKIVLKKSSNANIEKQFIKIGEKIFIDEKSISIKNITKLPKSFDNSSNIEFISADKITEDLVVRKWKNGDKIKMLGMKGTKKVSDVLTDLKVPSYIRNKQLLLVNGKDVVWIIGFRISELYKITEETKKKIKLCLD